MFQKIKTALISVSDKSDLPRILKTLKKFKIRIISSGGTYRAIKKQGFDCTEISKYTGFDEMLDGRVKTLHPKIHAGILHDRSNKRHENDFTKAADKLCNTHSKVFCVCTKQNCKLPINRMSHMLACFPCNQFLP